MNNISLHVGVNRLDPNHYQGWNGALSGCESDAQRMAEVARLGGFQAKVLLTADATAEATLGEIYAAAQLLQAGDTFLLTCACHGSQIVDESDPRTSEEDDGLDETWLLYNRMVTDDELYAALGQFRHDVKIFLIFDSCHSGTVVRDQRRAAPREVVALTLQAHPTIYADVRSVHCSYRDIPASVLLLAACQDDQSAAEIAGSGLFTATMLRIWSDGEFRGDYQELWRQLVREMPTNQVPNLVALGPSAEALKQIRPFSVGSSPEATTSPSYSLNSLATPMKEEIAMYEDTNGNWQDVMAELSKRLPALGAGGDGSLERLTSANAQMSQLVLRGAGTDVSELVPSGARGGTVVRAFWWGFHVQISHQDLAVFLSSAQPINSVIGAIGGGVPSPAAPFIGLVAAFIAGALALLKGLDRGMGVYVSMSWFMPGVFIPTSVVARASESGGLVHPSQQTDSPQVNAYRDPLPQLVAEGRAYWGPNWREDRIIRPFENRPRMDGVTRRGLPSIGPQQGNGNVFVKGWLSSQETDFDFVLHIGNNFFGGWGNTHWRVHGVYADINPFPG